MLHSQGGEENGLLNEISSHNVTVKRRSFPKDVSEQLRDVLDSILALALSLHKNLSLAFCAYSLFFFSRVCCFVLCRTVVKEDSHTLL